MPSLHLWDPDLIVHMFHLALPIAEKAIRPILVYLFLMGLLRLFGRREMAQLNPFDFIVLMMLSNVVQNAIIGEDNSVTGGLIGSVALCAFHATIVRVMYRHRRLDQFLQGRPAMLVHGGVVDKKALRRELVTMPSLLSLVRRQGFSHLDEVERCVLEPGGTFSIVAKEPTAEEKRQVEVVEKLESLLVQIEELRKSLLRGPSDHENQL